MRVQFNRMHFLAIPICKKDEYFQNFLDLYEINDEWETFKNEVETNFDGDIRLYKNEFESALTKAKTFFENNKVTHDFVDYTCDFNSEIYGNSTYIVHIDLAFAVFNAMKDKGLFTDEEWVDAGKIFTDSEYILKNKHFRGQLLRFYQDYSYKEFTKEGKITPSIINRLNILKESSHPLLKYLNENTSYIGIHYDDIMYQITEEQVKDIMPYLGDYKIEGINVHVKLEKLNKEEHYRIENGPVIKRIINYYINPDGSRDYFLYRESFFPQELRLFKGEEINEYDRSMYSKGGIEILPLITKI